MKQLRLTRNGNVLIISMYITFLIFILIFSMLAILYMQINTQIIAIKEDIYYIVQNVVSTNYYDSLSYYEISIDYNDLKDKVNLRLKEKYNFVSIDEIYYDNNYFILKAKMEFKPIILSKYIKDNNIVFSEKIKFRFME